MSSLKRDLVFLILQFLDEEKYKETVHKLEKESGYFFNMRYFADCVTNGEWDEVEEYLSGYTKFDDNEQSLKIFFEIRKQKYLEALDKHDYARAVEILAKDLKVVLTYNPDFLVQYTMLLTLSDFRENAHLSKYVDTKSARDNLLVELKKLFEANPLFRDKLQFPTLKNSMLRTLINQSLNWQHHLCKNRRPNVNMNTLFLDHTYGQPNVAPGPSTSTNPLMGSIPTVGGSPPIGAHGTFQPAAVPALAPAPAPAPFVAHQAVSAGPIVLSAFGSAVTPPGQSHAHTYSSEDLPKIVFSYLKQGSTVNSLDFHPVQQTLLLVGTNIGEITIWDVGSRERLVSRNFTVWELDRSSMTLLLFLAGKPFAAVNRVIWSPDGTLLGVAYSKHIVHIYSYHGADGLTNHLEIEAHIGNVSDIAFSQPDEQLYIISCGEDKMIKVWDAVSGYKRYTFEGHEAPVYSVYPHHKEDTQFIFSSAFDGKIKAWLYDNNGSRIDYDAPGHSLIKMAYSADGTRLFACGTNKEGESHLVEWDDSKGAVKRTYHGLGKPSTAVVQFDTTGNRFLAAGDEFQIKFWDMDNVNLLMAINADGGLPASPCLRFNKEGILLAVSTNDNGIKILANANGTRLLRSFETRALDHALDASSAPSGAVPKGPIIGTSDASSSNTGTSIAAVDRRAPMTANFGSLTEMNEPSQLRSLRLPDNVMPIRVVRMTYTNSGGAILALIDNAIHKLWKWQKNEQNLTGKATSALPPKLWLPSSGILMTNDKPETNQQDAVPCFSLSKNDSYVISASGGKISLFAMAAFKTMTTFMAPSPAATSLAFHPRDNNFVAIGMDDSSIRIYNVRRDEVTFELRGHQKRVTGLAFSNVLDVLVSSGADAQLCVWSVDGWEKQASKFLEIPKDVVPDPLGQTRVQFHPDQIHILVHGTLIAIFEAPKLECLNQWVPQDSSGSLTDAAYSCDGLSIYASFEDGTVCILTSTTLQLRCRINPGAYLPSNPSTRVYPVVVAAHPFEPLQLALGLSDGGVHVLEPLEGVTWGSSPSPTLENRAGPTTVYSWI